MIAMARREVSSGPFAEIRLKSYLQFARRYPRTKSKSL